MRNWLTLALVVCLAVFVTIRGKILALQRPADIVDLPDANGAIKLEFGLHNQTPRQWTGEILAAEGEVLAASGWHFIYPDRIVAKNGWDFTTRWFTGGPDAVYAERTADVPVLPNGITAAIHAPDSATFQVKTNRGNFTFSLADLKAAGRLMFLDDDVAAVFTPPARSLTHGAASQHDFPSVAERSGRIYVAWTTYQNEANLVYLAVRTNGNGASDPRRVLGGTTMRPPSQQTCPGGPSWFGTNTEMTAGAWFAGSTIPQVKNGARNSIYRVRDAGKCFPA